MARKEAVVLPSCSSSPLDVRRPGRPTFQGVRRAGSIRRRLAVLALAVVFVASGSTAGARSVADPAVHTYPTQITSVVVILFENQEAPSALKGPFFHYLAIHYAYASRMYAVCHPSAPNYLALTSGATYSQCGSDARHTFSTTDIADQIETSQLTWAAYLGSMPKACDTSNAYPYAVKHNPFVFYKDVVGNSTRCKTHDLSMLSWYAAVNASTVPNYAFITPNLLDDGHDTNVSTSSLWLHGFLTPLVNASSFNHTAYFVVYDEGTTKRGAGNTSAGPTNTTGGGHIYLSIVSPLSAGVGTLTNLTSHYGVLTTVEWLLNVGSCSHQDSATAWPPLRSAFS